MASVLSLCGYADVAIPRLTDEPSEYPVPTLDLGTSEKAIVISLHFTSEGADVDSAEVVYGHAHGHVGDPALLEVELFDLNGNVVDQLNAWNPRWVFEVDESGQERKVTLPEGTGLLTFPFRPDIAEMRVTDLETGQEVNRIDIIPILHEFCSDNRGDPECENVANRPPICDANGPYVAECVGSTTSVQLDGGGSTDPDQDPLTYVWSGSFVGGMVDGVTPEVRFSGKGGFTVNLTVSDGFGGSSGCNATVSVNDTKKPVAQCNAPATIVPPDAPISFTATANDVCEGTLTPIINEFDCFKFTKKGKRIDKRDSCEVDLDGNTITIQDSGGVGDNITWTVVAIDPSGNNTTKHCGVLVENPGKGRKNK